MASASQTLTDSVPTTTSWVARRRQVFDSIADGDALQVIRSSVIVTIAGAAVFGIALGFYAGTWAQVASSVIKLPLLLLGTAALCYPCFHLLQSWYAPRPLRLPASLALQTTALSTVALVWGFLAPPLLFLVISTRQYHLAQALALVVGAAGGVAGLNALMHGYRQLCTDEIHRSNLFFVFYFLLFAAVGGQLAWILRPFIGSPTLPFQLFRDDASAGNIFSFIVRLLTGG